LVIGLNQCCAGIWIFKEPPIPSFLIALKSENRWTFWLFENKISESKNCQLQVILKPERTHGFHERTGNKVAILWTVVICQNWVLLSHSLVLSHFMHCSFLKQQVYAGLVIYFSFRWTINAAYIICVFCA
jgi:hypothetical protein